MTAPHSLPAPLLPLDSPQANLALAGGKGANLARLARAGFPVPGGFILPTGAYQAFVAAHGLDQAIQEALQGLDHGSPEALQAASKRLRASFSAASLSPELSTALAEAYRQIGAPPVAVRSSATAEDLPELSFAGQQDTYLNVIGVEALQHAVVDCWSSLWTARAIGYRARNDIPQAEVSLAVVVQELVPAEASGVLFTANPLTGRRREMVIDATLGLGEALVSGQVEPDHYVVAPGAGGLADGEPDQRQILSKNQGTKTTRIRNQAGGGTRTEIVADDKRQAIPDDVILALAALGERVETEFGFPQDIEWAWAGGRIYLLQSRPITSLYPLPENLPAEPLQVLMALSAVQGIMEPISPLGQNLLKMVLIGGGRVFDLQTSLAEQKTFLSAGERLWINFTSILNHPIGRRVLPRIAPAIDPGVAQAFQELVRDPRLAPHGPPLRWITLRRIWRFALPTLRQVRAYWRDPDGERQEFFAQMDTHEAAAQAQLESTGDMWQDFSQRVELLKIGNLLFPELVIPRGVTAVVAGMVPFMGVLANFSRLAARHHGQPELAQLHLEISRGLPHNVTTEMDLALWETAQRIRQDPHARQALESETPERLAQAYLAGKLPPTAQDALQAFLARYGMRGPGEIDIGRPRWREQPDHILGVMQSYLHIDDPTQAPDAVFARGAQASQEAARRLEQAVRSTPGGALKARLVRWAISRFRALAGLREAPKFFAIRMMGVMRQGLLESGPALQAQGVLEQADDLFFLNVDELQTLVAARRLPEEFRPRLAERRATRAREMRRKQLPRVLLSDGTAYYEGLRPRTGEEASAHILVGDPVSPGVAEGAVRVVADPRGIQLQPGEILVCPGTDPAWTPLFLAAGGLVMEVGGMMTHGSVVAREYGIPAVVGVHQATQRLQTGQRVRVNGSAGKVEILPE